jgi:hypothetical protein
MGDPARRVATYEEVLRAPEHRWPRFEAAAG